MKYSTIEIRPEGKTRWKVTFTDLEGDRHDERPPPMAIGFYHYPTSFGRKKAFLLLKRKMIKERLSLIDSLKKTVSELKNLDPKL